MLAYLWRCHSRRPRGFGERFHPTFCRHNTDMQNQVQVSFGRYIYYMVCRLTTARRQKNPFGAYFAAEKTLTNAASSRFCAAETEKSPLKKQLGMQNLAECQSIAAHRHSIVFSCAKYFFHKTFLFTKITTFTNTVIAKKMVCEGLE